MTKTCLGETATKSGCDTGTRDPSLSRNTKGFGSLFTRWLISLLFTEAVQ
jgi:hypothetical protein